MNTPYPAEIHVAHRQAAPAAPSRPGVTVTVGKAVYACAPSPLKPKR